jgi:hypothetical protein
LPKSRAHLDRTRCEPAPEVGLRCLRKTHENTTRNIPIPISGISERFDFARVLSRAFRNTASRRTSCLNTF